jgi:hypothetical protein
MAENNRGDWRELCAAASREPDSEKLFSLVNQILQAFDADPQRARRESDPIEDCS